MTTYQYGYILLRERLGQATLEDDWRVEDARNRIPRSVRESAPLVEILSRFGEQGWQVAAAPAPRVSVDEHGDTLTQYFLVKETRDAA
ncbi:hypothetical protein H9623_06995 [Oerskovia sp. Sa1BUA8]|uniref:DUF4177 domain-containing protein n=1 Tax=Oerskovia douganii TaxID=2762210 RepID=A0A9D5UFQ0_9CELL|nr:hypothetical protein [Oerskovia douganii]MBE7700052.1 hypothetical protein [Oerskovia douganii]